MGTISWPRQHLACSWVLLGLLPACEGEPSAPKACDIEAAPPTPSADWCARVAPGARGTRSVAVDLSAAHAGVRFFSPIAAYSDADQALAAALDAPTALAAPDLALYASALSGIACGTTDSAGAFGAATVELSGDVAIVHPGVGTVALPDGAQAVMLDLRGLPNVPELRAALEAAVSLALASPIERATQRVRRHDGLVDEMFSAENVYVNDAASLTQQPIPATGAADLPLAVLTDAVLAPAAAELAATLRLAGRAWLVGEDVRAEVAEARWQGVGTGGVAYRSRDLYAGDERWPDTIPADRRLASPKCLLEELSDMGAPPAITFGPAERATIEAVDSFGDRQPADVSVGALRAALLIAHGATRTFYPYFATVGDTIDDRLAETLDTLGEVAPNRADARNLLRRFGRALVDGHQFVLDYGGSPAAGYFAVYIEDIAGEPVVRRSLAPGVNPGDTITSIGGVPAADWYETELARSGGATDGYRFNIATREYLDLAGPTEFGLRDPDGAARIVTVSPAPVEDLMALWVASSRAAGFLTDLGAPTFYYINLDASVLANVSAFRTALTEAAAGAAGLVLDMRGYPGVNHYEVAMRLVQEAFSSPIFRVPQYVGPDDVSIDESSYPLSPETNPSFAGPVALLVGHSTVSAAENFSTMLVDAGRVTVIGRQSAGTNGNITGVQLPAGFAFGFTGMEVLHADDEHSVFHGVGIVPDIEVELTAADFRDDIDPELEAAIAWLGTQ